MLPPSEKLTVQNNGR